MMCQWDIVKWKGDKNETRKDIKYTDDEQQLKEERMRWVPDILSVCMQDILYRRKSDLRAEEIRKIQVIWNTRRQRS